MTATADTLTDADALLRAICETPDDDAPRLILADWLDEHGEAERAEFIRIGVELARIGPPPIVVTERCYVSNRYGPNYYTMTGGEETKGGGRLCLEPAFAVGARVDVMKPRGRKEPMYGLRIHKIDNGPQRDEVIVVQDANSVKWEGDALRRRSQELLDFHACRWIGPFYDGRIEAWTGHGTCVLRVKGSTDRRKDSWLTWTRGFISRIRCRMSDFMQHGPAIVRTQPIERIEIAGKRPGMTRMANSGFYWTDQTLPHGHPETPETHLPPAIMRLLNPTDKYATFSGVYPSEAAAVAALSAAALAWCRATAGLGEWSPGRV